MILLELSQKKDQRTEENGHEALVLAEGSGVAGQLGGGSHLANISEQRPQAGLSARLRKQ